MEETRVLYRLSVTVLCFVCLGFSVGMCLESDALIKTYVSDESLDSANLKVPTITIQDWYSHVLDSKVPVMVLFTATGCSLCQDMSQILDQLDSEFKGRFKFYTVDVDKEQFIPKQYRVEDLPTTIIFEKGEEKALFDEPLSAERLKAIVWQYV